VGSLTGGTLAPPVPTWLVLTQGIAAVLVALIQLTQPGVDNLLTLLALLGGYWLLGGVLELVDLAIDGRGRAWRLLGASAGIAAGFVVLHEPLWSTLLVVPQLAPAMGWFGLAVGAVYLVRAFAGGGRGALVLGTQSVVLGVMLLYGSPQVIVWGGAVVTGLGGPAALVVALRGRLSATMGQARRSRQMAG
jgi:uncharacterized membrane protein HdeD (DUF308 family)